MTDRIEIHHHNDVYVAIVTSKSIAHELSEFFSFYVNGYQFMPAYKNKMWDGKIRLFNTFTQTLYHGLWPYLCEFAEQRGYAVSIDPDIYKPNKITREDVEAYLKTLSLPHVPREAQVNAIHHAIQENRSLLLSPTGCHAKGEKVLMYDGKIKNVEDVEVGEFLMGDDGTPRMVLELCRGKDSLYKITPKRKGNSFIVNSQHILSLKYTKGSYKPKNRNQIVNISVSDYLKQNKTFKHETKLYWLNDELSFNGSRNSFGDLDPYFCGIYLGDGHSRTCAITTMDSEIVKVINKEAKKFKVSVKIQTHENNQASTYAMSTTAGQRNPILDEFRKYGVLIGNRRNVENVTCGSKFIPHEWKISHPEQRIKLLAGLIDSDGWLDSGSNYVFCSKSKTLCNDVKFIAGSLGFRTSISPRIINGTIYHRVSILGDIWKIPVKIPRKKAKKKIKKCDSNVQGFKIELHSKKSNYYGFRLDGNHLYLTDDFLVTHNSGKSLTIYALLRWYNEKSLLIVPTQNLVRQMYEDFREYSKNDNTFDVERDCHQIMQGLDKNPEPVYTITLENGVHYRLRGNQYIDLLNNTKILVSQLTVGDDIDETKLENSIYQK